MKNQNDLIFSIVAIIVFLIIGGVAYGTKKDPVAPPVPEAVNTATPKMPEGQVVMANALPSGSNNQNAGGGTPMGGGRGAGGMNPSLGRASSAGGGMPAPQGGMMPSLSGASKSGG
jgi:hypothetical protein